MAKKNSKKNKPAPAKAKPAPTRARPGAGPKRPGTQGAGLGGLAAAATVLIDAGKPMGCKQLVAQMLTRRLWTSKGKTPAATIGAALSRDISAKKERSRFRKAGRGLFALRGTK